MERFGEIFLDQFRFTSELTGNANPGATWMWILLVIGVFGMIFSFERFFSLWFKYGNVSPEKFMEQVNKNVTAGDYDKALATSKKLQSNALPYVIMKGVEAAKSVDHPDFRTIQNGVDTAMMEIMPKLQTGTSYINLIGSVATLVGLAGTIFGLILAFDAVGQPGIPASQKSQMLASGISAAMGTTIGGLFIAVPMNVIYTVVIGKITKIVDSIDEHAVKFINLVQRVK